MSPLVCLTFQLGAREHYAVPRMLDTSGHLKAAVTDAWIPPGTPWSGMPGKLGARLRERFHPALENARVESFTAGLIAFETAQRISPPRTYWHACMQRNAWFERRAVAIAERNGLFADKPVVLAYSYAALGILRAAKAAGCRTVLMQIDPAIMEERIVRRECKRWERVTGSAAPWSPPPSAYWRRWMEEAQIAHRIVVNSRWAQTALERVGFDAERIRVVPLAFEPPSQALSHRRVFPGEFTVDRPLRVLFLGSLVLRKGISRVFDAVRQLTDAPVVFRFVGAPEVDLPPNLKGNSKVEWLGAVPRGEVHDHYRWADVFLFPTLSDGFGLTQIEAAAWGLPLIASGRCGEILRDGVNGLLLSRPTGGAIAAAIRRILAGGVDLEAMSSAARDRATDFSPTRIAPQLLSAVKE